MSVEFKRLSVVTEEGFRIDQVMVQKADDLNTFVAKLEFDGDGNLTERSAARVAPFQAQYDDFVKALDESEKDIDDLDIEDDVKTELAKYGIESVAQLSTLEGPLAKKFGNLERQAKQFIRSSDIFQKKKARIETLKTRIDELKAKVDERNAKIDELKAEVKALKNPQ